MLNEILKDFQKAIERLEEVLILEKTEINRDSAIKRFELCFDFEKIFIVEVGPRLIEIGSRTFN